MSWSMHKLQGEPSSSPSPSKASSLHYAFLTMTKMRGKIPLEKKEMYGNQEGYVLTKFNQ
jgi:hypothetical protein